MSGNACVRGSGRTAAIVKTISSPRPTVTNGEYTGEFANCRLEPKHHTDHAWDIVPAHLSLSSAHTHGFRPYLLRLFGMHYEKNNIRTGCECLATLTHVHPCQKIFNLFWFRSYNCVSGVLYCQISLCQDFLEQQPVAFSQLFYGLYWCMILVLQEKW